MEQVTFSPAGNTFSPIGDDAEAGSARRAARSAEYRAVQARWARSEHVARQIIYYRTRNGMTQADLAKKVGTSVPAVSRIESGHHETTVKTLHRFADALGLDLHVSFEERAERAAAPAARSRVHV